MAYIDREAAIEAAIDAADEWDGGYNPHRAVQIRDGINAIHAADVRPAVRGKWDMYQDGSGVCSVCGKAQFQHWEDGKPDKFCHNCGAAMEES